MTWLRRLRCLWRGHDPEVLHGDCGSHHMIKSVTCRRCKVPMANP